MPKKHGTIKQKKERLYDRITPYHVFNSTSIFNDPIGGPKLDKYTVDYIKANYANYFVSWIENDAKAFLLTDKY
jgi:hypothetical protein